MTASSHATSDTTAAIPRWTRPALALLSGLAAALFGAATIVTFHNLRYSYARVLDILGGSEASALELTAVAVPAWVSPLLQDLSVVSPALVVFTSARMLIAAILLLGSPRSVRNWPAIHFPFPEPYKVYYIQMGLLGTIVGFVLAFAEVDPRAERQSLILLEALGTALWSTLTAIVLAYVACPVVEGAYRRLREATLPPDPVDTRSALDLLRTRTTAAAGELDALVATTRRLSEASAALAEQIEARSVEARLTRAERQLVDLVRIADSLTSTVAALREQSDSLAIAQRRLDLQCAARESRDSDRDDQLATLHRAVAELRVTCDTWAAELPSQRASQTRLDALEAWLSSAPRRGRHGDGEGP